MKFTFSGFTAVPSTREDISIDVSVTYQCKTDIDEGNSVVLIR